MQLFLPLKLKCVNPPCTNEAARNDWFCGIECYERVRINGLRPARPFRTNTRYPENRKFMVMLAFVSGLAVAFTALA